MKKVLILILFLCLPVFSQFQSQVNLWRVVVVSTNFQNVYPRFSTLQNAYNSCKDSANATVQKYFIINVASATQNITDYNTAWKDSILNRNPYMKLTAFGQAINDSIIGVTASEFNLVAGILSLNSLNGINGVSTDNGFAFAFIYFLHSAKHFTTALVDKMRFLLPQKRILPTATIGGNNYYIWIITSRQAKQLTSDSAWKQMAREILPREKDGYNNWLFTGALGIYNGFIFLEDMDGWGAHTNTNAGGYTTAPSSGVIAYGPEDTVNSSGEWNKIKGIDTANFQCSVILGQQGVNIGIAKKLWFTDEIWDHKQKSEVGAHFMSGAERTDQFDTDNQLGGGAGAFVEHTGSAVVTTYSPSVL